MGKKKLPDHEIGFAIPLFFVLGALRVPYCLVSLVDESSGMEDSWTF
jgi:hypothetical protein